MKQTKVFIALSVLLAVGLCLAPAVMAREPVVIGLQAPLTGPWAYEGQMARQSCEIAAELINARGGVLNGRKIELRVVDDEGQPGSGALAAMRLAGQQDVVGVISTYGSSVAEPASSIYEKGGKVNIAYGATAVRLSERGLKYFFRTCGRDDSQGAFFAEMARDRFNARRIAILHDNTAFSKGLAESTQLALKPMIEADQTAIVYFDAVIPGDTDFQPHLTRLARANPDLWYFTGYYAEAALLLSQARTIGITIPFVGGNAAINDQFVRMAGTAIARGAFMTNEPLPTDLSFNEARAFLAAYEDRFGEIPSSPWPLYAADALMVIAHAVDQTGATDGNMLADYLRNELDGLPGVTGPISFTDQGDRENVPIYLYVVDENGRIVVADRPERQ